MQGRSKIVSCIIGVGRHVWSAGHDNKIKVWDPQAGTEIKQLEQTAQVFALAFDGACVWAALWNKSIALYDAMVWRRSFTLCKLCPPSVWVSAEVALSRASSWSERWKDAIATLSLPSPLCGHRLGFRYDFDFSSLAFVYPFFQVRLWSGSWDKSIAVWSVAPASADADTF
jgi:WD40 repeat protein